MRNVKSLKSQIVFQFAVIILPVIAVLAYQTASDVYHSGALARSYRHQGASHEARLKYKQFVSGVVDAVDTGQLGAEALRALEEASEKLRNLGKEDHGRDLSNLLKKIDLLLNALKSDRSMATLMPMKGLINQTDVELGNEDVRYEKENRQAIEENIDFANIQKYIVSGAIFFTLLITTFFIFSLIRNLTAPLTRAVELANIIARGELNSCCGDAAKKDIGQLVNSLQTMNGNLYRIVSGVKNAADSVASSSVRLSADANDVAASVEKQSELFDSATISIEEMRRSMDEVSSLAISAVEAAAKTQAIVHDGNVNMASSIDATQRIAGSVAVSAAAISALNQSVQKIGELSSSISDIADQTNLLALNAAIEAARAGEHGRGFAVVADEVKKLAERTSTSTTDIVRIVSDITMETAHAVSIMDQVRKEVNEGARFSTTTGDILQKIDEALTLVSQKAHQITQASQLQCKEGDGILKNIREVSSLTVSNVNSIKEVNVAAENMTATSEELQTLVGQFKLI